MQALPPGEVAPVAPPGGPDVPEPDVLPEEKKPEDIAVTDAQLKRELAALRRAPTGAGGVAVLQPDGTASPPIEAPEVVQEVIHAGNLISNSPYIWGGGHGRWLDNGYDCSGSVSFALFAGGLLSSPLTSGGVHELGRAGAGPLDHDLHEPRPRLHGRRRATLRHERADSPRFALAAAKCGPPAASWCATRPGSDMNSQPTSPSTSATTTARCAT